MGNYCPLIKEECKEADCIMWANQCLLSTFLSEVILKGEAIPCKGPVKNNTESDYSQILLTEPEQIADEIIAFSNSRRLDSKGASLQFAEDVASFIHYYWENKGLDFDNVPPKVKHKVNFANSIAMKKIMSIQEKHLEERIASILQEEALFKRVKDDNVGYEIFQIEDLARNMLHENGLPQYELGESSEKIIRDVSSSVSKKMVTNLTEPIRAALREESVCKRAIETGAKIVIWDIERCARTMLVENELPEYDLPLPCKKIFDNVCSSALKMMDKALRQQMEEEKLLIPELVIKAVTWAKNSRTKSTIVLKCE